MSSGRKINFQGTVSRRSDAAGLLRAPGDAVLIERGRPRLLLLSCPCGCGEELPINLDSRAGPAWRLFRNMKIGLSLFPSVWRQSGCESHFIIWRNEILLFGSYDDELESLQPADERFPSDELVFEMLPHKGLTSFVSVADILDAVPWDVQSACRRLVKKGLAYEGVRKQKGMFGRR